MTPVGNSAITNRKRHERIHRITFILLSGYTMPARYFLRFRSGNFSIA